MTSTTTCLKIAILCFFLAAVITLASLAYGFTVEFAWDSVQDNRVEGYKLYQSDISGQYTDAPVATIPVPIVVAAYADNSEPEHGPELVIDADLATYWHTPWNDSVPAHPHSLVLTLSSSETITSLRYIPRSDANPNGTIQDYAIYISDSLENWGDLVTSGTFGGEGSATFEAKGKHLKLIALSEINGGPWASVGEIELSFQPHGVVEDVSSGTHYWVCTAYGADEESTWSNEVSVTLKDALKAPSALHIKIIQ